MISISSMTYFKFRFTRCASPKTVVDYEAL